MSFLSIFHTVNTGVKIGVSALAPVAPYIEAIPVGGSIFALVFHTILALETLLPAEGLGDTKKPIATAIVAAAIPGIDKEKLAISIDAIVAALNAMNALSTKSAAPTIPPTTIPISGTITAVT